MATPPHTKLLRENEKLTELAYFYRIANVYFCIPLWMIYWVSDILYMPQLKWQTLALRIWLCIVSLLSQLIYSRVATHYARAQVFVCFMFLVHSVGLTLLIARSGGVHSLYWVDINLISIAGLALFPFSKGYFALAVLIIYGPFYIWTFYFGLDHSSGTALAINSFFNVSVILIMLVGRIHTERLRISNLSTRLQLEQEIESRNQIIHDKTQEALRLELAAQVDKMAAQMAAQIAHDIRSPLAALNSMTDQLTEVSEEKSLILKTATTRINDIASTLLIQNRNYFVPSTSENYLIHTLVDEIIAEKKLNTRPTVISKSVM